MGKLRDMFLIWLASRGSHRDITRKHKGSDELYLVRYHLFRCRWLNIYLHNFFLSDEEEPHDHPWNSISILLRGGYIEHHHDGKQSNAIALATVAASGHVQFLFPFRKLKSTRPTQIRPSESQGLRACCGGVAKAGAGPQLQQILFPTILCWPNRLKIIHAFWD